jgi:hypothetical protein
MKKAIKYIVLSVCVVMLVSCYWVSGFNSGSVRLDLSALGSKGLYDRYARVWLVADKKIYPLGQDKDYVQKLIPGYEEVTVTLENIPVGPTYRVWLSIVTQEVDGFSTYVWAESVPFPLSAGSEVAVVFDIGDLNSSPFTPIIDTDGDLTRLGKGLTDVENYLGTIYATDRAKLYEITSFNTSPGVVSIDTPANHVINSVSKGINAYLSDSLVVNTDRGIVSYNGDGSFDPPPPVSETLPSLSVLDSDVGYYPGSFDPVLYFRSASSWGGTAPYVEASPSDFVWLNQSSGKVLDLVVPPDLMGYVYFATDNGAFRFWGEYLRKLTSGESPNVADYKATFKAPAKILSLGLLNPEVEVILMGTENGVYEAETISGPEVINTPYIVDGTQGYRIRKIATNYSPNFAAYLSDAYLFVWDGYQGILEKYPLCAGFPGRITGMTWFFSAVSGNYYLIISGDEGLVFKEFSLG